MPPLFTGLRHATAGRRDMVHALFIAAAASCLATSRRRLERRRRTTIRLGARAAEKPSSSAFSASMVIGHFDMSAFIYIVKAMRR